MEALLAPIAELHFSCLLQRSQYILRTQRHFVMRTPVALKIALAIAAIGGTQAILPVPLAE